MKCLLFILISGCVYEVRWYIESLEKWNEWAGTRTYGTCRETKNYIGWCVEKIKYTLKHFRHVMCDPIDWGNK